MSFPSVEGPGNATITRSTFVIFAVAGPELPAGAAGASAVTGAEGADVSPVAACAAAGASGCCAVLGDVLEELEVVTVGCQLFLLKPHSKGCTR